VHGTADGKSVASCVTPVGDADKQEILTIEGFAQGSQLHHPRSADYRGVLKKGCWS
jgi:aerobic-type carbon monoxide dehydrogenase small subunit (CoxS/CutS family)